MSNIGVGAWLQAYRDETGVTARIKSSLRGTESGRKTEPASDRNGQEIQSSMTSGMAFEVT